MYIQYLPVYHVIVICNIQAPSLNPALPNYIHTMLLCYYVVKPDWNGHMLLLTIIVLVRLFKSECLGNKAGQGRAGQGPISAGHFNALSLPQVLRSGSMQVSIQNTLESSLIHHDLRTPKPGY